MSTGFRCSNCETQTNNPICSYNSCKLFTVNSSHIELKFPLEFIKILVLDSAFSCPLWIFIHWHRNKLYVYNPIWNTHSHVSMQQLKMTCHYCSLYTLVRRKTKKREKRKKKLELEATPNWQLRRFVMLRLCTQTYLCIISFHRLSWMLSLYIFSSPAGAQNGC